MEHDPERPAVPVAQAESGPDGDRREDEQHHPALADPGPQRHPIHPTIQPREPSSSISSGVTGGIQLQRDEVASGGGVRRSAWRIVGSRGARRRGLEPRGRARPVLAQPVVGGAEVVPVRRRPPARSRRAGQSPPPPRGASRPRRAPRAKEPAPRARAATHSDQPGATTPRARPAAQGAAEPMGEIAHLVGEGGVS